MLVFFWGFLCLVLCAPGLKTAPRLVWLAALLVGLDELAVVLPVWWWHLLNFDLQMNWTGKLFCILLSVFVIYGWRVVSPEQVGLVRPVVGSWRIVLPVVLVFAFINFTVGFSNRHYHAPPTWEAHLYELTMPGIAEELFLRGVFLGLLSGVFPRTIPLFGTRTSWGGLAGLVVFVLWHCLSFKGPLTFLPHAHFSLERVLDVGVYGLLFLWVRERNGSCWAAMAAHNLTNVALYVGLSVP
jgi:predicted Abi (CAAX) family protease